MDRRVATATRMAPAWVREGEGLNKAHSDGTVMVLGGGGGGGNTAHPGERGGGG